MSWGIPLQPGDSATLQCRHCGWQISVYNVYGWKVGARVSSQTCKMSDNHRSFVVISVQ